MDVGTGWRRLDAEYWVHMWGMVATTTLVLWALAAVLGGPVLALLPAALAGLAGWLTSAWRQARPWAWWVWTIGGAAAFATALDALVSGRAVAAAPLVATGVLLLLLFHPDSRARIETASSAVR